MPSTVPPFRDPRPTSVSTRRRMLVTALASAISVVPLVAHAAEDDLGPPPGDGSTTTSSTSTTTTSTSTSTTTTTVPTTTTTVPTPSSVPPSSEPSTPTTIEPTPSTDADPDGSGETDDPDRPVATVDVPRTTVFTTPIPPGPVLPPHRNIAAGDDQLAHILATIRFQESRGIYDIPPNKGNASGAYQFIESTWNGYGGYQHAYLAPPHVQDERAAKDVIRFLDMFDGDVSMVPIMWYFPLAATRWELLDTIPKPEAGNVLTIREYQTRWLSTYASISGKPLPPVLSAVDVERARGRPPLLPESNGSVPSVAFPVLGPSRMAIPDCDDAHSIETADIEGDDGAAAGPSRADIDAAGLCTEQAPAIVFGVKLQPVMAVADGIVTDVDDTPESGRPVSVTVTAPDGLSYVYDGFNDDNPGTDDGAAPLHLRLTALARVGSPVRAGQIIGFLGDSSPLPVGVRAEVPTDASITIDEDAVAPHIRLSIVDLRGTPVDAFGPVVDALFRQSCSLAIGQWSVPGRFASNESVVIETTDEHRDIDSEWVITSNGQVHASGWAALVNPTSACGYVPETAHGPGADGSSEALLHWAVPLDLPTWVWIRLARLEETVEPGGFVRP